MDTTVPPDAPSPEAARAQEILRNLLDPAGFDPWIGAPGVAVHCARGTIQGRPVLAYALETGHPGGALGPREAEAIIAAGEHARRSQVPLVGVDPLFLPRVELGVDAVLAAERVARQSARLAQVVPQVVLLTDDGAREARLAGFADLVVGVGFRPGATDAHVVEPTLASAIEQARRILRQLPATTTALRDGLTFAGDGGDRVLPAEVTGAVVGPSPFDVHQLIHAITDPDTFVELDAGRGPALVTGLASIYEQVVGLCACQPRDRRGFDSDAFEKVVELVGLCERLSIPLINLVDVGDGEVTELVARRTGALAPERTLRHAAALMRARQTMGPCVSLVLHRCQGPGYLLTAAARPHHAVLAWTGAELVADGPPGSTARAFEGGWVQKILAPSATVPELVHWTRWSRSERDRVTSRLRPNDPLLYNLKLD